MRKLIAAVAATGTLVSGAVTATAAEGTPSVSTASTHQAKSSPAYMPPPIAWGSCQSPTLQHFTAQCGMLTVPLDYSRPRGTKITIAVSRIAHTVPSSKYQGVMLVNPGGPGGSGLTLSVLGQFVPKGAGNAYDWIGFDPRGVGSSRSALTCDGSYFGYDRPYYVPTNERLERTWLGKTRNYAKACGRAGGSLLHHLKTTDSVADMESIRKALGRQQINYYGFSYGTYLGQVYSTLHPERVRRMVMDGVVNPKDVWYRANLNQDVAFDRNMRMYFDWVAKHDAVYHLGTTGKQVTRLYYSVLQRLRAQPADGIIGPDEWTDSFLQAGYYVFGWEDVARAFSAAVIGHDFSGIKALYDGSQPQGPGADNAYAVYLGVQCTDVRWPQSWAKWERDNWQTYRKAPFETWANAWYNAPCRDWRGKPGTPVRVNGNKVGKVLLLISETLDAATPYPGALELRHLYPKASLIEGVGGTTHAGSLSGVTCTDNAIATYLATGKVPARKAGNHSDLRCPPVPAPDPQPSLAKRSAPDRTDAALQKLRQQLLQGVRP